MKNALAVHFRTASLPKNLADELKEAGFHNRMRQELFQPYTCSKSDDHLRRVFLQKIF